MSSCCAPASESTNQHNDLKHNSLIAWKSHAKRCNASQRLRSKCWKTFIIKIFPENMVGVEWKHLFTVSCMGCTLDCVLCYLFSTVLSTIYLAKNTLMFHVVHCSILIEKICCAKSVFQVSSFVANLGEATARKFTLEGFFLWR